jgi:hypothetical protein
MMPLYIKLDIKGNGKIYAFTSDEASWAGVTSSICSTSVPAALRRLAAEIAKGPKPK